MNNELDIRRVVDQLGMLLNPDVVFLRAFQRINSTQKKKEAAVGFIYTTFHIKNPDGQMFMLCQIETLERVFCEWICRAIDDTYIESWKLYNWQNKDNQEVDPERLTEWWQGFSKKARSA